MSGAKLDDLFDHAEASLDDLFDQAEVDQAATAAETPDFMQPRPIPGIPGIGGEKARGPRPPVRPQDEPAPPPPENPTFGQMLFPNTLNPKGQSYSPVYSPDSSGRIERYIPTGKTSPFDPLADVAGLPTRLLGSASDDILPGNARGNNADGSRKSFAQGMANPDAGVMRPAREYLGEVIANRKDLATDEDRAYAKRVGDVLLGELAAAGYIVASAAEDPTVLVPGAATPKAVAFAERLAPKAKALGNTIAEAPNKFAGRMAEELSGVSEEALRMAGIKAGREALAGAAGRQKEIGDELLRRIENADEAIPERQKVEEALAGMGNMSLEGALQSLEAAKVQPTAGRLLPNEIAANDKIDSYIRALRGGEMPTDFRAATGNARRDLSQAEAEAANLTDLSKQAGKEVSQAARDQKAARSDMGKAGNRIKTMKRHETDFGWWYAEAKDEAQKAAQAAREAADNLEAASAVSGIRSAELEAAQKAAAAAERNYATARAAEQLYTGRGLKEVGQDMIKTHGLKGDDLRQVLAKAKQRAESQPTPPDLTVTAPEYRQLRKKLDVNIDFDTEEGALVNTALKTGRRTMKDALIQKAKESGNPDYEKWMQSWSDKLDKLERIKGMLGGKADTSAARVERFIGTLFGKNTEYKQQLVRDLDEILGSNILGDAKTASLAGEFGKTGKPGIWPRQFTGRSLLGAVYLSPPVAAVVSSPYAASRFVLPFTQGLEAVLKKTGGVLSSRGLNALKAAGKARNAALQMRLLKVIEQDANTLPGLRRVAESDQTRTEEPRYATR